MGRQKAVEEEKTTSSKPKIEDEAQAAASMRLAYQELSLDQKKTEDKIRTVDPKKANQVRYFRILLKFTYSEKATKFCEIFTLLLSFCTVDKSKVSISQNFVAFSE